MKKLYFLLTGGFFTFLLFITMTFLIKPDLSAPIPTTNKVTYIPFKIVDRPPEIIKRSLPEKPKVLKEPVKTKSSIPRKQPKNWATFSERGLQYSNIGVKVVANAPMGLSPWGSNNSGMNDIQPSVRINPTYPVKAARNNIEGFVTLSFDISKLGKPMNIQVIEAKPRGYFEKSARKALKKWKYDPKVIDHGEKSQQVTLAFQLEKEA